jgi:hypothetical protein
MMDGRRDIAGRFTKALEDLTTLRGRLTGEGLRNCSAAAHALMSGGRFYVPDASYMIEGKLIDAGMKFLLRLPFEVTCLLNRTLLDGQPTWKISIGFELAGAFNQRWRLVNPEVAGQQDFGVMSLVQLPAAHGGVWFVFPAVGVCGLPADRDGFEIRGVATGGGLEPARQLSDDVGDLMNLCVMLNLCNVEKEVLSADVRVSGAKQRAGARPLNTYHVLTVDGERWHGESVAGVGGAEGVRSHVRRGHIRRLDDDRRIWVRATVVRGSRPGFAEKDYSIPANR